MEKSVIVISSSVLLKYLLSVARTRGDQDVTLKNNLLTVDGKGEGVHFEGVQGNIDYAFPHSSRELFSLRTVLTAIPEQPICLSFDGMIELKNVML